MIQRAGNRQGKADNLKMTSVGNDANGSPVSLGNRDYVVRKVFPNFKLKDRPLVVTTYTRRLRPGTP